MIVSITHPITSLSLMQAYAFCFPFAFCGEIFLQEISQARPGDNKFS